MLLMFIIEVAITFLKYIVKFTIKCIVILIYLHVILCTRSFFIYKFTFSSGTFLDQRNMFPRGKNSPFSRIPSNDVNPGV